jgi:hypothetical protein
MNLAAPAPRVEAASAESAGVVEPATVQRALPSDTVIVTPPPRVEQADPSLAFSLPISSTKEPSHPLSTRNLRLQGSLECEGYAGVIQGALPMNFLKRCMPCFHDRDFVSFGEIKRYIMLQNTTCFVYNSRDDLQPLYVISLHDLYAIQEDPMHMDPFSITVSPLPGSLQSPPNLVTILLKYVKDNSQAYQFTFDTDDDSSLPKTFLDAVQRATTSPLVPVVNEHHVTSQDNVVD